MPTGACASTEITLAGESIARGRPLVEPVMRGGRRSRSESLEAARARARAELATLPEKGFVICIPSCSIRSTSPRGCARWRVRCSAAPSPSRRRRLPDPAQPLITPSGTQPRDLAGEARAMDDVDDALDVLVGVGRLLGELGVRRAADHDPVRLELLPQLGARCTCASRRVRLSARPGAVAGAAERALGALVRADEHVRGGAHAAGDEHRLADPGRRGSRVEGPNARVAPLRCTQQLRCRRAPRSSRCCGRRRRRAAGRRARRSVANTCARPRVRDHLPVGEREVRRRAHRREVAPAPPATERRAGELPVRAARSRSARMRRVHRRARSRCTPDGRARASRCG